MKCRHIKLHRLASGTIRRRVLCTMGQRAHCEVECIIVSVGVDAGGDFEVRVTYSKDALLFTPNDRIRNRNRTAGWTRKMDRDSRHALPMKLRVVGHLGEHQGGSMAGLSAPSHLCFRVTDSRV